MHAPPRALKGDLPNISVIVSDLPFYVVVELCYWLVYLTSGLSLRRRVRGRVSTAPKQGSVAKELNNHIGIEVMLTFFFCILGASLGQLDIAGRHGSPWYLEDDKGWHLIFRQTGEVAHELDPV